jgi:vitamin B12 transporter
VRFGATWFHNDIRDLIESCSFPPPNPNFAATYCNIGRAETYGVESFVSLKLSDRLSVRGDYTWLTARDEVANTELLRRPKSKASATADWKPIPRLRLAASLVYVGAWVDFDRSGFTQLRASPFSTVDLSGEYDLGRGLTLFARIDNLLDRRYEDPVGFDKPGIGAFGGIKVALKP